jgi:hypothetical protein
MASALENLLSLVWIIVMAATLWVSLVHLVYIRYNRMSRRYTMSIVVPTPRFLLRLPPDLRAELEQIAEAEHRTLTNLIVHALREWLAGRGRQRVPDEAA